METLAAKQVASVVVPMRTEGATCMQRAIAAAQNSLLGNGGSAHRLPGWSGFVDHGHHAAFDRKTFLELGGYDETFPFNEDAEFDRRLTTSGRRIFLDGANAIEYYPRDRFRSLSRQYYAFGRGRARTVVKHGAMPRLRQLAPVGVLLGCLASVAARLRFAFPVAAAALCVRLPGLGWRIGAQGGERVHCAVGLRRDRDAPVVGRGVRGGGGDVGRAMARARAGCGPRGGVLSGYFLRMRPGVGIRPTGVIGAMAPTNDDGPSGAAGFSRITTEFGANAGLPGQGHGNKPRRRSPQQR